MKRSNAAVLCVILVLPLGLITLPMSSVSGAFPGANGKIVYDSDAGGNRQIYDMNADGSAKTQLTNDASNDLEPKWSATGSKIVFVSDRDGNREIYVMNADGSSQTRLTNNPAVDDSPAWSPDGTKIVFDSNRDGNNEIYVMNADGSSQTQLTSNPATNSLEPNWSPDGTKIVFARGTVSDFRIWVMNADGSGQTQLTNPSTQDQWPAWSPDGHKIAFSRGPSAIWIMNADGSGQTQLTNCQCNDFHPAWSPDGSKIAFGDDRGGGIYYEIWVMNADGSCPGQLTNNQARNQYPNWQPISNTAPRTITFSGYTWYVKSGYACPGPNSWSDSSQNVWVDQLGQLHLALTYADGVWHSSEVYLDHSLGYGKYTFYLASRIDLLDLNAVGALFTYESDTRELDIEFSSWSEATTRCDQSLTQPSNAQYVVQPCNAQNFKAHIDPFNVALSGDFTTHFINWSSGTVEFQSIQGHYPSPPGAGLIQDWPFRGSSAEVPPPGNERVHMSIWLYNGVPPSGNGGTELVVSRFTFQPLTVFSLVRGSDNGVYLNQYAGSSWVGWTQLPGATLDGPGAVQCGGQLYLAVQGTDNGIYFGSLNTATSAFSGWSRLSSATSSGPGLAADSSCNLYMAVRGMDNGVYLNSYTSGSWQGWSHLPGATKAGPGVAFTATTIYLAVRGTDNAIYFGRITLSGMTFNGWTSVGGATYGRPGLDAISDSEVYMTVGGTDNGIYLNRWNGAGWAGWVKPAGGATPSGPGLIVSGGELYLMVQGTDNGVYWSSGTWGGSWSAWTRLTGATISSPTLA